MVVHPAGTQPPGSCERETPLTLADVRELVSEEGIPVGFILWAVDTCGVDFILDADSDDGLRTLGVDATVVSRLSQPVNPVAGANWTPPIDHREMVWMRPGSFSMGSPDSEPDRDLDETLNTVTITAGFWVDVSEVSNEAFQRFVIANPIWRKGSIDASKHDGNYLRDWSGTSFPEGKGQEPVVWVSWHAAREYALWAGKRLLTEAEWEYAARAGTSGRYWWGERFDGNRVSSEPATTVPKLNRTSPAGIADMLGGVWEWTSSLDGPYPYEATDREAPGAAGERAVRGGGWGAGPRFLRVANRSRESPEATSDSRGFRCAR
jgi:formylglycine-generating enzyme required for sulfatase activity